MFLNKLSIILSLILVLTRMPVVFAQTAVIELDPVQVYGDSMTVEEVNTIKQKALKTHKVIDIAEILSDEFIEASLIRKSAYGNEVGLRGFTKSNLRFTLDQTLVEGSCGSRKDPPLSHANLLAVSRLEVKEGPYDVTVPGALGGNINVITKKTRSGIHGELFSKFGAYGYLSQGGYVTGGSEQVQGLIGYNYAASGQYQDGNGETLTDYHPGYSDDSKDMNAFSKQDLWAKAAVQITEKQSINLSAGYGLGQDILTPRVGMDTEYERTFLNKVEYVMNHSDDKQEALKVSAYYNRVEHEPTGRFRTGVVSGRRIEAISFITGGQIENATNLNGLLLTYGLDAYYRNWTGDVINRETGVILNDSLFPDVDETDGGAYVKAEKNFGKWWTTAGLRVDAFETKANEALTNSQAMTDSNRQLDIFPGAQVFTKYILNDENYFFGGLGMGTRTPTAVERYTQQGAALYGNPDLKPAHNYEADLGLETRMLSIVRLRAKAFYSYIQDFIYQTDVPAKTWTNIDARIFGGDINADIALIGGFSLSGGIARQRGLKASRPEGNDDPDLAEIAPLKAKAAINYETDQVTVTLEWVHAESNEIIDSDAGETTLDGWHVANVRAGWQMSGLEGDWAFINGLGLNVGVENIFNQSYAVANSYEYDPTDPGGANVKIIQEPGRYIYGSLSYAF